MHLRMLLKSPATGPPEVVPGQLSLLPVVRILAVSRL